MRSGDVVSLVASEQERATLERMQATMAVLEGHAEHVMDAVGAPLLPSLPRLRAALDARRRSQSAPARLLQRLLGLEMKLQASTSRASASATRSCARPAWRRSTASGARPEMLPSSAELDAPLAVAGANGRSPPPERLSPVRTGASAPDMPLRCNHRPTAAYKQVFERARPSGALTTKICARRSW